jgi:hypothetical protein
VMDRTLKVEFLGKQSKYTKLATRIKTQMPARQLETLWLEPDAKIWVLTTTDSVKTAVLKKVDL